MEFSRMVRSWSCCSHEHYSIYDAHQFASDFYLIVQHSPYPYYTLETFINGYTGGMGFVGNRWRVHLMVNGLPINLQVYINGLLNLQSVEIYLHITSIMVVSYHPNTVIHCRQQISIGHGPSFCKCRRLLDITCTAYLKFRCSNICCSWLAWTIRE